jgi:putative transposase
MREIDIRYLKRPFYGSPRMTTWLKEDGHHVNLKRVARLMRVMGLQAAMPGPHTSKPHPEHKIYPYLLHGMDISASNSVWSSDITYIPMARGFMYLVAVMDWFSRYVIAWNLSSTLEADFCVRTLSTALKKGRPDIFNTDQGSQFTSEAWTKKLLDSDVRISMDGRGRCFDNIFIERLWRTVKYEDIYLKSYDAGHDLHRGLSAYFHFYNHERRHTSLGNQTPAQYYAEN